jgi:Fur family transcriptional regulator, ferric uptake regulator
MLAAKVPGRRKNMSSENQELRKAGLKVTLPRVKIMQILESSESPSYEC